MTQTNTTELQGSISNDESKPSFSGSHNLKKEAESEYCGEYIDFVHENLGDNANIKIEEKGIDDECLSNEVEDPLDVGSSDVRRGKIL